MNVQIDISNFESEILNGLKSDMKQMSHAVSSELAHQISDTMVQEYLYVIDRFYSEYDPEHYMRHADRGMRPGLQKTFKKYYKNPHNTIYYGGIEISNDKMYDDYHDPNDKVLSSFLEGYHGRSIAGIKSSLLPYKHMLKFRDKLVKDLKSGNNALFLFAKNKAKNLPYKMISIK